MGTSTGSSAPSTRRQPITMIGSKSRSPASRRHKRRRAVNAGDQCCRRVRSISGSARSTIASMRLRFLALCCICVLGCGDDGGTGGTGGTGGNGGNGGTGGNGGNGGNG